MHPEPPEKEEEPGTALLEPSTSPCSPYTYTCLSLPSGKLLGTKSQPEALTKVLAGENAPMSRVLLDSWHSFPDQRKDVPPSNLLGPSAPSASNYQCLLLRITLCPAAFPCTPSLVSWGRQQLASTWHLLLFLSTG